MTTEQGATLPGAEIELLRQDVPDGNGKPRTLQENRAKVVADEAGRFEFPDFYPAGTVSFRARASGRAPAMATVAPGGEIIFRLERAPTVPGSVQDAGGNGRAGARFWLLAPDARVAEPLPEVSGARGEFSLSGVPASTRAVAVIAEGRGPGLAFPDPSGSPLEVVLPPANADFQVRVRDAGGVPVEKARVRLAAVGMESAGLSLIVLKSHGGIGGGHMRPTDVLVVDLPESEGPGSRTDAGGRTTISDVATGAGRSVLIRVDAQGFETAWLRTTGDETVEIALTSSPER